MKNRPEKIIIHHSGLGTRRDSYTFDMLNNYHKHKWNFKSKLGYYAGYHYFIDGKGTLYQARREDEVGAHTKQEMMNYRSIGICLAGNFDVELPSNAQVVTLKKLIKELKSRYNIMNSDIHPHRKYAHYKSCYGSKLSDDYFLDNEIDKKFIEKNKGRIFIQVEGKGELWWIHYKTGRKIRLGRNPKENFEILKYIADGITNRDLDKFPD